MSGKPHLCEGHAVALEGGVAPGRRVVDVKALWRGFGSEGMVPQQFEARALLGAAGAEGGALWERHAAAPCPGGKIQIEGAARACEPLHGATTAIL